MSHAAPEHVDVVGIGAGQAGLAMGYNPARAGRRFLILDAAAGSIRAVLPSSAG